MITSSIHTKATKIVFLLIPIAIVTAITCLSGFKGLLSIIILGTLLFSIPILLYSLCFAIHRTFNPKRKEWLREFQELHKN